MMAQLIDIRSSSPISDVTADYQYVPFELLHILLLLLHHDLILQLSVLHGISQLLQACHPLFVTAVLTVGNGLHLHSRIQQAKPRKLVSRRSCSQALNMPMSGVVHLPVVSRHELAPELCSLHSPCLHDLAE